MEANTLQAKDLRIGNIVTDEWGISTYIVESINDKGINLYIDDDGNWAELADRWIEQYYKFESVRGIPLSEDWLLKLGFEKDEYDVERPMYYTLKGFRLNCNLGFLTLYNSNELADFKPLEIKFVHQLQNLYHSLTGEELTISL